MYTRYPYSASNTSNTFKQVKTGSKYRSGKIREHHL